MGCVDQRTSSKSTSKNSKKQMTEEMSTKRIVGDRGLLRTLDGTGTHIMASDNEPFRYAKVLGKNMTKAQFHNYDKTDVRM